MKPKEIKAALIAVMGLKAYTRRYEQLKDAFGARAALQIMKDQELEPKPTIDGNEYMHHIFYEIG